MKFKNIALFVILSVSFSAFAESPNWNFVEAGYASVDVDDSADFKPTGFTFGGSKLINENVFVVASYSRLSEDLLGTDIDLSQFSAGFGGRYEINTTTDFYAIATYQYVDLSVDGFGSEDDTGFGLSSGFKSMLTPSLEVDGGIGYMNIADADETSFYVGAAYFFNQNLATRLTYSVSDDANTFGLSVRYSF